MGDGVDGSVGVRERLVAAARQALVEDGVDALGVREVARRAGVSHGAPRRHFPTLATLCSAVAADGFRSLIAAVDRAVRGAGPTATGVERLQAAGRGYVAHALAEPATFALMFRAERCDRDDPDLAAAAQASFAQLRGLVEQAQAEGWRADADAGALAVSLWASVHGFATLAVEGPGFPTGAPSDVLLDLHLRLAVHDPAVPAPAVHDPAGPSLHPISVDASGAGPTTRRPTP